MIFALVQRHLSDSLFKLLGRMLAMENSRNPDIDCVTWLLVITPYEVLKQKGQLGKKELQNIQFEEKKYNIGLTSYIQRDEKHCRLRHQNFAVQWNAGSGTLRVGST